MPEQTIPSAPRPISPWRQPLPSGRPEYRQPPRSEPGAPPPSRIPQSLPLTLFRLQGGVRRDAKNVTLKLAAELIVLQNDVQCLVPWNFDHLQSDRAHDVRIQDNIQPA